MTRTIYLHINVYYATRWELWTMKYLCGYCFAIAMIHWIIETLFELRRETLSFDVWIDNGVFAFHAISRTTSLVYLSDQVRHKLIKL